MPKFTDTLKQALNKKNGQQHLANSDNPDKENRPAKKTTQVLAKKPPTRSAGRGR
jgi:hypothetical protein